MQVKISDKFPILQFALRFSLIHLQRSVEVYHLDYKDLPILCGKVISDNLAEKV